MCCRVAACCYVTDLRLATLIIAVLSLLGNVGMLAFWSWCIDLARVSHNHAGSGEQATVTMSNGRVALAFLALMLLICIAAIALDVVLFFGAFRRRRDVVQYWCQGHAVLSGAYLVYSWLVVVGLFGFGYVGCGVLALTATAIGAGVSAYFLVVVRSYYLRLQRACPQQQYHGVNKSECIV